VAQNVERKAFVSYAFIVAKAVQVFQVQRQCDVRLHKKAVMSAFGLVSEVVNIILQSLVNVFTYGNNTVFVIFALQITPKNQKIRVEYSERC